MAIIDSNQGYSHMIVVVVVHYGIGDHPTSNFDVTRLVPVTAANQLRGIQPWTAKILVEWSLNLIRRHTNNHIIRTDVRECLPRMDFTERFTMLSCGKSNYFNYQFDRISPFSGGNGIICPFFDQKLFVCAKRSSNLHSNRSSMLFFLKHLKIRKLIDRSNGKILQIPKPLLLM